MEFKSHYAYYPVLSQRAYPLIFGLRSITEMLREEKPAIPNALFNLTFHASIVDRMGPLRRSVYRSHIFNKRYTLSWVH